MGFRYRTTFLWKSSRRSAARSRLERTSVVQLPYPRPRDWPTTPLANPPPVRVPALAPQKGPIHLRLPRSAGMGDARSGYRTGIGRSLAAPLLGRLRRDAINEVAKDRSCTAIEKDPLHLLLEIERRFRAEERKNLCSARGRSHQNLLRIIKEQSG